MENENGKRWWWCVILVWRQVTILLDFTGTPWTTKRYDTKELQASTQLFQGCELGTAKTELKLISFCFWGLRGLKKVLGRLVTCWVGDLWSARGMRWNVAWWAVLRRCSWQSLPQATQPSFSGWAPWKSEGGSLLDFWALKNQLCIDMLSNKLIIFLKF